MKKTQALLLLLLFVVACDQKNKQQINTYSIKAVEAHGYVVPKDSMREPTVTFVDETKLKRVLVGKAKVTPTNINILSVGIPKIVIAGNPRVCTPGQDTLKLPLTTLAVDSFIVAGEPKVEIARDRISKDQNTQSFSTYTKLQGLNQDKVKCLLNDDFGNIWVGQEWGGVSRYDGKSFEHFTEKEGLIGDYVTCLHKDKTGNIWIGTWAGVSKYDGKSFTNYNLKKSGLKNNLVGCMFEDKSGNIWFGAVSGLARYDGKSITSFTEKQGLAGDYVTSISQDNFGNLWFGTYGGGVSKYDGKSFFNYTEKDGLVSNKVFSLLCDAAGKIWIGTENGLSIYDGKVFSSYTSKEGLIGDRVNVIFQDKLGVFWFGTESGISSFDGKFFRNYSKNEGVPSAGINCFLTDNFENFWIGSNGGLSRFNGDFCTHYTQSDGLVYSRVRTTVQDNNGNLWFGSEDGLSKYDGKSFTNYTKKEGLTDNFILCSYKDIKGNLWFGTRDGGVTKYDGQYFTSYNQQVGLADNHIGCIFQDHKENIWFCSHDGGISMYDGQSFTNFFGNENLMDRWFNCGFVDKSGNIWFGLYGKIIKYDGGLFTLYDEKDGVLNRLINSIVEDKNNNLWFIAGGGIMKYDGNYFFTLPENVGFSDNEFECALVDDKNDIWLGSRVGLSKISRDDLTMLTHTSNPDKAKTSIAVTKNYGFDEGFLGVGCISKNLFQAQDGKIWVGTNDRLSSFDPKVVKKDSIEGVVVLNKIELFNQQINWKVLSKGFFENKQKEGINGAKDTALLLGNGIIFGDFKFDSLTKWYSLPVNLSLSYKNNYVKFSFIGITMNHIKSLKYQYRLDGLEDNWSNLTNETFANYSNLPPGKFTFKVRVLNSNGFWRNESNYTFTIRPPWWLTWWFKTLVVLLAVGSIWYYIKWRERKLKAEKEVLEKTVEERTEELVQKNSIVEQQKHLVEEKHKEITDSINYAERIQRSFMATKELLDENLKDYFVLFQPKDVVSGDFYWGSKLNNDKFTLVTADSTGHGVPGAIMSLLNITGLELAIKDGLTEPADILNGTRKTIIDRLKKDGSAEGGKDGMDCSLISFNFKANEITYAAANNPIWIVRRVTSSAAEGSVSSSDVNSSQYEQNSTQTHHELLEFAPDKMPVGKHDHDSVSFTQHIIEIEIGDVIYTLTDGYPDQFGGPKGKKFMYKKLKELLISISQKPMHEQKKILEKTLKEWMGDNEQVDDVCVIGVRV